jgi:hypothetical protein
MPDFCKRYAMPANIAPALIPVLGSFAAAILVTPSSIQGPDVPDGKLRG